MDNGEGSFRVFEPSEFREGFQGTEVIPHPTPPPDLGRPLDGDVFYTSASPVSTTEPGSSPEPEGGEHSPHDEGAAVMQRPAMAGNYDSAREASVRLRHAESLSVLSQARTDASELHTRAVLNAYRNRVGQSPAPTPAQLGSAPALAHLGRATAPAHPEAWMALRNTDMSHQASVVPRGRIPATTGTPAGSSLWLPPIHQAVATTIFNDTVILPPILAGPYTFARRSFSLPPSTHRQEPGSESPDSGVQSLVTLATAALALSPGGENAATTPADPAGVVGTDTAVMETADIEMADMEEDSPLPPALPDVPVPPALPSVPDVHNQWRANFVRTSICDVCDSAGHPAVQRCTVPTCGWQVCLPCVRAGRLDARHAMDQLTVTWIDTRPGTYRARARRAAREE